MSDALLDCRCGHIMRVSSFAVGSRGRCPGCGTIVTVRQEYLRPVESPVAVAPSVQTTTDDTCARCSKAFRGEWDRVARPHGTICHHCSVLAVDGLPEVVFTARPGEARPSEADYEPLRQSLSQPKTPFTRTRAFRIGLLGSALAVVLMTVVLLFTEGFEVPDAARSGINAEEIELPGWAALLLGAWDFVAVAGAWMIALYIVLSAQQRLPRDSIAGNVLHIGIATLALWVMHFTLAAAALLIGQLPMAGAIYAALLMFARLLLAYLILDYFFDFDFWDFLLVVIVFALLDMIVFEVVKLGLAAALYHVVT